MNAPLLQGTALPQEPPRASRLARPSGKLFKVFFILLAIACGLLVLFMTMDTASLGPGSGAQPNTAPPPALGQMNIAAAPPAGEAAATEPGPAQDKVPLPIDQTTLGTEGKKPPQRQSKVAASSSAVLPSAQRPRQSEPATTTPNRAASATALFSRLFPIDKADLSNEAKESWINGQIHRSPSSAVLHAEMGAIHAQRGDWPEAAHALQAAVERDHSNPAYHRALAICLEHLRRPAEAKTHYLQSLELLGQRRLADESPENRQRIVIDGTGPAS